MIDRRGRFYLQINRPCLNEPRRLADFLLFLVLILVLGAYGLVEVARKYKFKDHKSNKPLCVRIISRGKAHFQVKR